MLSVLSNIMWEVDDLSSCNHFVTTRRKVRKYQSCWASSLALLSHRISPAAVFLQTFVSKPFLVRHSAIWNQKLLSVYVWSWGPTTQDLQPGLHFKWKSNVSQSLLDLLLIPLSEMILSESHSVVSDSLRLHGPYSPWNSPGQNTGVSSRSLLQGIFLTQGLNPGIPVEQADSLSAEP